MKINSHRDNIYVNWNGFVSKCDVSIPEQYDLECEGPIAAVRGLVLEIDVFPLHDELVPVIQVADARVVRAARVEVRHERRDVLRGRQPAVHVVPGVEEAARGDGDVLHQVAVERELEAEVDGGGAAVALGQHGVVLHPARRGAGRVLVIEVVEVVLVLLDGVRVVLVQCVLAERGNVKLMLTCDIM